MIINICVWYLWLRHNNNNLCTQLWTTVGRLALVQAHAMQKCVLIFFFFKNTKVHTWPHLFDLIHNCWNIELVRWFFKLCFIPLLSGHSFVGFIIGCVRGKGEIPLEKVPFSLFSRTIIMLHWTKFHYFSGGRSPQIPLVKCVSLHYIHVKTWNLIFLKNIYICTNVLETQHC